MAGFLLALWGFVSSLFGEGGVIDNASLTYALKAGGYQGREPRTLRQPELPAGFGPNALMKGIRR